MPPPDIACPVCSGADTVEFLRRERVPVHQNLLAGDAPSALGVARGTLAMRICEDCGFVFNAAFQPELLDYGEKYENTQTCSGAFAGHVEGLARDMVERSGVRNRHIVEVGCGKGAFLSLLVEYLGAGNTGVGYDPSYLGEEELLGGRLRFVRGFYGPSTATPADVVVCRHVIEHIERPLDLLRAIRATLNASAAPRVFFETPCVEWIFRNQVGWDMFYEHCSLFTPQSLSLAFRRAGFDVFDVEHVFEGQYLWLEGGAGNVETGTIAPAASVRDLVGMAKAYGSRQDALLGIWESRLATLRRKGPVAVWGAGAKGVTFCNLVDPSAERIACVVDVNPAKQRNYLVGTGHRIVSPGDLAEAGVRSVLVLNPNYLAEIASSLSRHHPSAHVIDLMQESGGSEL